MTDPQKPKKSPEELRAKLESTPETKEIAKKLGMTTEAYIELVLSYALNPGKQPELNLISEADAKANGAATTEEVKSWFEDQMKGSGLKIVDGFDPAPDKKRQ